MDSYVESDSGVLMIVNGFDPMLRWDGQTAMTELAGLAAPTVAPTMIGTGQGPIVGTYTAYLRFVDKFGFYSNLSPISNSFTPVGQTGSVTAASFAAPIQITTSAPHGLTTGTIVKITGVGGNTDANGTWTITVVDATDFTLQGSSGNAAYTGSGSWNAGVSTITYSNVQTTTDPKVVRRQILRNSDGEASVYYVDIDKTDLSSTTFTSTETDTFLTANEQQPILDSNGLALANLRYVPPTHFSALACQLGRFFACGKEDEARGAVQVTTGSLVVQGIGTQWTAGLAGRVLYVVGAVNNYQISSVNVNTQQLTLLTAYQDSSDPFSEYAVRAVPGERRSLYYTPAAQPESWPPLYQLSIQEDEDELVCPMSRGSFLYILEQRHIYKLTFQDDPAIDGAIFLSANRGCINKRCWVLVDNDAYMLDEYGCHNFDSQGQSKPISESIQEIFRTNSLFRYKINWSARRYFFAVLHRPNETIRWFVALGGEYLPRYALCYNYRLQRWWIEQYPFAVGAGVAGHINGVPTTFVCGESAKVYAMWTGTTDVANPNLGTIRGAVTSSGIVSLTDTTANFCISGQGSVINSPVTIVDGTGKTQTRRVVNATSTQLFVDTPWTNNLDTTSVYQLGGVNWSWKSTWLRLAPSAVEQDRAIEILFASTEQPCTMDMRIAYDFGNPEVQKQQFTSKSGGGVRSDPGSPDKVIDLTKAASVVMIRIPGHRERFLDGRRYDQIELRGSTNQDPVSVFELILEGMGNLASLQGQP